jgi:hypothetical protein
MNKQLLHSYYFLLGVTTLVMGAFTIYTGSQTVSYGQTISDLEKQKQVLVAQQVSLEHQIGQETALASAQNFAQADGYVLTTRLVQLPTQTQVALR